MSAHEFTIFIGGPGDVLDEHKRLIKLVESISKHYPERNVRAKHWNIDPRATPAAAGTDYQAVIEEENAPAACDIVLMVFRGRLGTPARHHGQDYPSSSAYELESALARGLSSPDCNQAPKVYVFFDRDYAPERPDVDHLSGENLLAAAEVYQSKKQKHANLIHYLEDLSNRYSRLNQTPFDTPEHLVNLVQALLIRELKASRTQTPPTVQERAAPRFPGFPFRSFASLTDEDNDIFYGREDDVRIILGRLASSELRFVCITGRSGTGKSSLLQAGILPALTNPNIAAFHNFPQRPGTQAILFTPGDRPFTSLALSARGIRETDLYSCLAADLAKALREGTRDQASAIATLQRRLVEPMLRRKPPSAELLLCVDQAEELWNACSKQDREAFLSLLSAAAQSERLRVLVTLRGDQFDSFREFGLIASLLNEAPRIHLHHLLPPDMPALEQMITTPADFAGAILGPGLLGAILGDAAEIGSAALPLVAHTLSDMIQQAAEAPLTLGAYRALHGLEGAVETTVARAGEISDVVLHTLFDLLFDLRGGVPVRCVVDLEQVEETGKALDLDLLDAVNRLVSERVLVAGSGTIELAHDALFEAWSALRNWIAAHRPDLEIRDELARDATRWMEHGRRRRHIRLRPEALDEMLGLDAAKPYLFRSRPEIAHYLKAAEELRQRELLIGNLKGGHVGAAMDAWRKGARLGREDRGTEPNQLRAPFHAAVTGDDRADEAYFAPGSPRPRVAEDPSVFDEKDNVTASLSRGLTPLHIAAVFGHLDLMRSLIKRGADPRQTALSGFGVLHQAAYGGHLPVVRFLVEEIGIDVNILEDEGATPLLWACQRANRAVIDFLRQRGARLDLITKNGWSPLTEACRSGDVNLVSYLLAETKSDVNDLNSSGIGLLFVACQNNSPKHAALAAYLIGHGAHVEVSRHEGLQPLVTAAGNGALNTVELLLAAGADANTPSMDGSLPLLGAANLASSEIVRMLIAHGADPNAASPSGETPLMVAAREGREENVKFLLQIGANPDAHGAGNWTALQYACDDGDIFLTRLLLEKADPNITADDGWTALHLAAAKGHFSSVVLLIEHGADLATREKRLWNALHLAAANGRDAVVRLLLDRGTDIAAQGGDQWTPLHLAAASGHETTVALLLERGADIASLTKSQRTTLHLAAANGHEAIVRLLIERGAVVDAKDKDQFTPLHLASRGGHTEVVLALLDHGAAIDAKKADLWTPLHLAANNGHEATVRLLLDRGADFAAQEEDQWTPLHLAAASGREAIVRLLIAHGAIVDAKDKNQFTPLHLASGQGQLESIIVLLDHGAVIDIKKADLGTPLHLAAANGHGAVVRLLLDRGADIAAQDKDQWTPLHLAAANGHEAIVRLLIGRGAIVDAIEEKQFTPLHLASRQGHTETVLVLLDHGAMIDAKKADLWTPLHLAASNGHESTVRLLLDRGADIAAQEEDQWTPLHLAAAKGHLSIVILLLEHGADLAARTSRLWNALHLAAANGHDAVARLLLDRGADITAQDKDQWTPLHLAAASGREAIVRLLIAHGAIVDAKDKNQFTPLHLACRGGQTEVVLALLDHGAAIDAKKADLWTPLHLAANNGHEATVRLLLDRGADIAAQDEDQCTPLHLAAANGHEAIVRLLIDRGAVVDAKDKDQFTPLHLASRGGHTGAVVALLDHGAAIDAKKADLWTPLHLAANNGHEATVRLLLDRGADVAVLEQNQRAPLHLAAATGHDAVVRLLLDRGADIAAQDKDQWTPLHVAAANGREAIVALLLERGADLGSPAKGQRTALHLAAANGHETIVRLLIDSGATVDVMDSEGMTAVVLAAEAEAYPLVDELVRRGATRPPLRELEPLISDRLSCFAFSDLPDPTPWLVSFLDVHAEWLAIPAARRFLRKVPLPFSPGLWLLAIEDRGRRGKREKFALFRPDDDFVPLNWTNEPIYSAIERHGLKTDDANLVSYVKFFFHWVRGQRGRFILAEELQDVPWLNDATAAARTQAGLHLRPVAVIERRDDRVILAASIVFKNALFFSKILVALRPTEVHDDDTDTDEGFSLGQTKLFDEDLLIEELPVHIDPPAGPFG